MKFVPLKQTGRQITEVDSEWVFSHILNDGQENSILLNGYVVRINIRYILFKNQRSCAVCGIIGNRMFLEKHEDADGFGFYLYAETKSKEDAETHMVLMTEDHIVPRCHGGSNEINNLQTLCVNCNYLKGETEFTVEKLRSIAFLGYRIYKSSFTIRKTKEILAPLYTKRTFYQKLINRLEAGLDKVSSEKERNKMISKLDFARISVRNLNKVIQDTELQSQTTGIVPEPKTVNPIDE